MDIGFYIADLLRNQDEVSLPGLGTFTKVRVPGSYNPISNSFSPPSYEVSFTDKLADFNSLYNYISLKKNLSLSSAEYFVKKFTSSISEILKTSGIAEVKPLGIIRQKNEILAFEPSLTSAISGEFYGLKPIIERKGKIESVINEVNLPVNNQGGSIEDFINSHGEEDFFQEQEPYADESPKNRTLLVIFGTFIALVIAAIALYYSNPTVRDVVKGMMPGNGLTTPPPADSGNSSSALLPLTTDSLTSDLTENPVDSVSAIDSSVHAKSIAKEPEVIVETTTIEIIGAAFGKRNEAEAYISAMKKKGFQARILENMPGPLFKVSLASFADKQTAQQELNRIQKEVQKDAWTYSYKSKKIQ